MQSQISINTSQVSIAVMSEISKSLQIISIFLLASIILFGTGFVNISAVHNAAHDTRHSQGFPCH